MMQAEETGTREPVRFGGWSDYREWADHDFRRRTPSDETALGVQRAVIVEALTEFAPISVLEEEGETGARRYCHVLPDGGSRCRVDFTEIDQGFDADDESALVRPYVRAGGRSGVRHDLQFETVVEAARPYATLPVADLTEDQRAVCRACVVPQSVAEVAVTISAPLGLARTIISDSIDKGYLRVHSVSQGIDGKPSMELLERVHAGLSRLA